MPFLFFPFFSRQYSRVCQVYSSKLTQNIPLVRTQHRSKITAIYWAGEVVYPVICSLKTNMNQIQLKK